MSGRDYPLMDGTMVRQYEYSGTQSYTVFRYLPSGDMENVTFLFAREEVIDPSSIVPCPYYAIDGNEVDKNTFDEKLKGLITNRIIERSAWMEN